MHQMYVDVVKKVDNHRRRRLQAHILTHVRTNPAVKISAQSNEPLAFIVLSVFRHKLLLLFSCQGTVETNGRQLKSAQCA
jgi:hypothetical protein